MSKRYLTTRSIISSVIAFVILISQICLVEVRAEDNRKLGCTLTPGDRLTVGCATCDAKRPLVQREEDLANVRLSELESVDAEIYRAKLAIGSFLVYLFATKSIKAIVDNIVTQKLKAIEKAGQLNPEFRRRTARLQGYFDIVFTRSAEIFVKQFDIDNNISIIEKGAVEIQDVVGAPEVGMIMDLAFLEAELKAQEQGLKYTEDYVKSMSEVKQLLSKAENIFSITNELIRVSSSFLKVKDKQLEYYSRFVAQQDKLCHAIVDFRGCKDACSDQLTSVEIQPAEATIRLGQRTSLAAVSRDSNGVVTGGHVHTFTALNPLLVNISYRGLAEVDVGGMQIGRTSIIATNQFSNKTGQAIINVLRGKPPEDDSGGGNPPPGGGSGWRWDPSAGGGKGAWVWDDCAQLPTRSRAPADGCWHYVTSIGCGAWIFDGVCGGEDDEGGGDSSRGELELEVITSQDPNEKVGPAGVGENRFISRDNPLPYTIYFENKSEATAAAADIVIKDQLDTDRFDLNTFSLGRMIFNKTIVEIPTGLSEYSTDVDLRPEQNLLVRVLVKLDKSTGLLTWHMTTLDPLTGILPEDPTAGFLPPNKLPPEGEGQVSFSISPKQALNTNDRIVNSAQIFFDGKPLDTPIWLNTIDVSDPISSVDSLSSIQASSEFTVKWSGSDQGSGIKDYTIYTSADGGPFIPWLVNTPAAQAQFTGQDGHSYSFFSISRDNLLRQEAIKTSADTTTTVKLPSDLELSATATLKLEGPAMVYQIFVKNNGPAKAKNAAIRLDLPSELKFLACTVGEGGVCDGTSNTPTATFESIDVGGVVAANFVASFTGWPLNGGVINSRISVSSSTTESVSVNNTSEVSYTLPAPKSPALKMKLSANKLLVTVSDHGLGCFSSRLLASAKKPTSNSVPTNSLLLSTQVGKGKYIGTISGLAKLKGKKSSKTKLYFMVDCGVGTKATTAAIELTSIKSKTSAKSAEQILKTLKKRTKVS